MTDMAVTGINNDMVNKEMTDGRNDVQDPWVLVAQKQVDKQCQNTEA